MKLSLFLAPYLAIVGLALWFFRRVILAPWARYMSHSVVKTSASIVSAFVTVKRVHWYPPFTEYEETWHSNSKDGYGGRVWFRESDGAQASHHMSAGPTDRASQLTAILDSARAREVETEELAK